MTSASVRQIEEVIFPQESSDPYKDHQSVKISAGFSASQRLQMEIIHK